MADRRRQLLIHDILRRAEESYGDVQIVTRTENGYERYRYADFGVRVRKLAAAAEALGIGPGDHVGTVAWNGFRSLEIAFALPCLGVQLTKIDVRLTGSQLQRTVRRLALRVLFVEPEQLPLVARLADSGEVEAIIVLAEVDAGTALAQDIRMYEQLLADQAADHELAGRDERVPSGVWTEGVDALAREAPTFWVPGAGRPAPLLTGSDSAGGPVFFGVTTVSAASAWGAAYAAMAHGATLVLPGTNPTPGDCVEIIEDQRVTVAAIPAAAITLMRDHIMDAGHGYDLHCLERIWVGGSADPELARWWADRFGTELVEGWGETDPAGYISPESAFWDAPLSDREASAVPQRQPTEKM